MIKIYPSLMSNKSIGELKQEIKLLEQYCNGFHIDVMDNIFVPNLAFEPNVINQISRFCQKQLFIHVMVKKPIEWINLFNLKKNDIFAFHIESEGNHLKLIEEIHKKKLLAAITINPKTKIEEIFPFTSLVNQVLIMSVEPGFSGQKFIPESFEKVIKLAHFKKTKNLTFEISIDGGINENNIVELATKGVQNFAVSSAIFMGNPLINLKNLYSLIKNDYKL